MKKFEKILLTVLGLLLMLTIIDVPGVSSLFVITNIIALGFYLFLGYFYFNNIPLSKELRTKDSKLSFIKVIISVFTILAIALGLVGLLFFAERWWAYMGLWVIGIYASGIMFAVNLIFLLLNKGHVYRRLLVSVSCVFGMLVFCGVFYYYLIPILYRQTSTPSPVFVCNMGPLLRS